MVVGYGNDVYEGGGGKVGTEEEIYWGAWRIRCAPFLFGGREIKYADQATGVPGRFFLTRRWTAGLFNSRRASAAIQRAVEESSARIFLAVRIAARFSARFLFPILRSAQFTAFLTKLRSSLDSLRIISSMRRNFASGADLSL